MCNRMLIGWISGPVPIWVLYRTASLAQSSRALGHFGTVPDWTGQVGPRGLNWLDFRYIIRGLNWLDFRYIIRGLNWLDYRYIIIGLNWLDFRYISEVLTEWNRFWGNSRAIELIFESLNYTFKNRLNNISIHCLLIYRVVYILPYCYISHIKSTVA
jgi:hypothetical protein